MKLHHVSPLSVKIFCDSPALHACTEQYSAGLKSILLQFNFPGFHFTVAFCGGRGHFLDVTFNFLVI